MRILVVEDHAKLATTVATVLRREGMAVDLAFDGHDALAHAATASYDVIVLDRNLPGMHGDDVCQTLLADGCESRVLMLTAAGTVTTGSTAWTSAPTTTCPSRSTSPSCWPASARSAGAPDQRCRRSWSAATCASTRRSGWPLARSARSR